MDIYCKSCRISYSVTLIIEIIKYNWFAVRKQFVNNLSVLKNLKASKNKNPLNLCTLPHTVILIILC